MIFDYMTLKLIWWCLVGILLLGFALTAGFDFGVGMMLPFAGKTDMERRVLINSIGPTWEGNQTWFITAGASMFAAWPLVYAAAFSSFYVALMLLLFSLLLRPAGFDYRNKVPSAHWRSVWDWGLFAGGLVPPLIFGVAFGNLLTGIPFHYDDTMRLAYSGNFFALLTPFGLLCGLLAIALMLMHGATFLRTKTEGLIAERAARTAMAAAAVSLLAFIGAGIWIKYGIAGYRISAMPDPNSAFIPTMKTVSMARGAWLDNYARWPLAMLLPAIGIGAAVLTVVLSRTRAALAAFLCSGLTISMILLTAAVSMFPFVLPSSQDPNSSLTAWDAVSSQKTLGLMFWIMLFMVPVVSLYTTWVYRIMRGKVTEAHIREDEHSLY